jgi:hypothetical protein
MPRRSFTLALIFLLLVMGCTPSSRAMEEAPSPAHPAPTADATDIPRQNALIFVEFFAGT